MKGVQAGIPLFLASSWSSREKKVCFLSLPKCSINCSCLMVIKARFYLAGERKSRLPSGSTSSRPGFTDWADGPPETGPESGLKKRPGCTPHFRYFPFHVYLSLGT